MFKDLSLPQKGFRRGLLSSYSIILWAARSFQCVDAIKTEQH